MNNLIKPKNLRDKEGYLSFYTEVIKILKASDAPVEALETIATEYDMDIKNMKIYIEKNYPEESYLINKAKCEAMNTYKNYESKLIETIQSGGNINTVFPMTEQNIFSILNNFIRQFTKTHEKTMNDKEFNNIIQVLDIIYKNADNYHENLKEKEFQKRISENRKILINEYFSKIFPIIKELERSHNSIEEVNQNYENLKTLQKIYDNFSKVSYGFTNKEIIIAYIKSTLNNAPEKLSEELIVNALEQIYINYQTTKNLNISPLVNKNISINQIYKIFNKLLENCETEEYYIFLRGVNASLTQLKKTNISSRYLAKKVTAIPAEFKKKLMNQNLSNSEKEIDDVIEKFLNEKISLNVEKANILLRNLNQKHTIEEDKINLYKKDFNNKNLSKEEKVSLFLNSLEEIDKNVYTLIYNYIVNNNLELEYINLFAKALEIQESHITKKLLDLDKEEEYFVKKIAILEREEEKETYEKCIKIRNYIKKRGYDSTDLVPMKFYQSMVNFFVRYRKNEKQYGIQLGDYKKIESAYFKKYFLENLTEDEITKAKLFFDKLYLDINDRREYLNLKYFSFKISSVTTEAQIEELSNPILNEVTKYIKHLQENKVTSLEIINYYTDIAETYLDRVSSINLMSNVKEFKECKKEILTHKKTLTSNNDYIVNLLQKSKQEFDQTKLLNASEIIVKSKYTFTLNELMKSIQTLYKESNEPYYYELYKELKNYYTSFNLDNKPESLEYIVEYVNLNRNKISDAAYGNIIAKIKENDILRSTSLINLLINEACIKEEALNSNILQ